MDRSACVSFVICTTEFSVCLRDKGLEEDEELVLWDEVLVFICCCATTAADGIVTAIANIIAVANAICFLTGMT